MRRMPHPAVRASCLLASICLLAAIPARAESSPEAAPPGVAGTAARGRDAGAFTGPGIGTVDTTSAILAGTRWYVFDSTRFREEAVAGTFLVDGQARLSDRLAVGASLTVPFLIGQRGDRGHGGVFGNPALWVRGNVFDDGANRLGLSLTTFVPAIWDLTDAGTGALILATAAGNYDPGRYMPATLTLRPDVRYQLDLAGVLVNAELGLDFLFMFEHDDDQFQSRDMTSVGLHAGLEVGYRILGIVTPYAELQLSRLLRVGPNHSFDDFSTHVAVGPGVQVAIGPFLGDFYALLPVTRDLRDLFDAIIGFRLGGRF